MARVHQLLRWANKREVARELTRRGFEVSGETLNRWVREEREIPAIVERLVLELYGLDTTKEAPRPEWAGGLATKADIDGLIETLIPVVLDRVWQQSRPELLRLLRDELARGTGGQQQ